MMKRELCTYDETRHEHRRIDETTAGTYSCTGAGEAGLHLYELVGGTGVEHHQGEEELERTLFLHCAAATASPPQSDTET